jgi:hypothetical protein
MLGEDLMPKLGGLHGVEKLRALLFLHPASPTPMPDPPPSMAAGRPDTLTAEEQKWLLWIYSAVLQDAETTARLRHGVELEKTQLRKRKKAFEKAQQKHREEVGRGEVVPRSYHQELIAEELRAQDALQREVHQLTAQLHELSDGAKK